MHKINIVKDKIKELKTKISMILGRFTRYFQLIDISINKQLKDELKKRYTKYCIDQKDTKAKVTQTDLINRVGDIWYDDKLTSEMFYQFIKNVGITLTLDGSEDEMLIGHNSLLEDDQVIVEQVDQPENEQDEGMKDAEIDDNKNNYEEEDEKRKERDSWDRVYWTKRWFLKWWKCYWL